MSMEIAVVKKGDVTVALLPGHALDAGNVAEFRRDVVSLVRTRARVVFDMSNLRSIDSPGLGVLLSCLRQLSAVEGDLKLCSVAQPVRAYFELARMNLIFDILATPEDAVRAFKNVSR